MNIISALKNERRRLLREAEKIESAIALLGDKRKARRGRKKRRVSAASRKSMARAARRRWRQAKREFVREQARK